MKSMNWLNIVLFLTLSLFSSHFYNLVFGCFWQQQYENITTQFVYFWFCIANVTLQTENIVQKIMQLKWRKKNEVT